MNFDKKFIGGCFYSPTVFNKYQFISVGGRLITNCIFRLSSMYPALKCILHVFHGAICELLISMRKEFHRLVSFWEVQVEYPYQKIRNVPKSVLSADMMLKGSAHWSISEFEFSG